MPGVMYSAPACSQRTKSPPPSLASILSSVATAGPPTRLVKLFKRVRSLAKPKTAPPERQDTARTADKASAPEGAHATSPSHAAGPRARLRKFFERARGFGRLKTAPPETQDTTDTAAGQTTSSITPSADQVLPPGGDAAAPLEETQAESPPTNHDDSELPTGKRLLASPCPEH